MRIDTIMLICLIAVSIGAVGFLSGADAAFDDFNNQKDAKALQEWCLLHPTFLVCK